ncbi:hypothetical protein M514_12565 [Trichuris suis]|uniref:Uncharacterized protein n=1 Tax=Trichuris suis TaxID=68888 RepID=A0A085N6G7_9BILA|nr:hypothetical protein M514_12565 [Trichuris suis]
MVRAGANYCLPDQVLPYDGLIQRDRRSEVERWTIAEAIHGRTIDGFGDSVCAWQKESSEPVSTSGGSTICGLLLGELFLSYSSAFCVTTTT